MPETSFDWLPAIKDRSLVLEAEWEKWSWIVEKVTNDRQTKNLWQHSKIISSFGTCTDNDKQCSRNSADSPFSGVYMRIYTGHTTVPLGQTGWPCWTDSEHSSSEERSESGRTLCEFKIQIYKHCINFRVPKGFQHAQMPNRQRGVWKSWDELGVSLAVKLR